MPVPSRPDANRSTTAPPTPRTPVAEGDHAIEARTRIVLVRTSHPGNIGAAARAMLTMGFGRLTLVAPKHFPDPAAVALASGATAVLDDARVVPTLDDALAGASTVIGLSARPREFAGRVLNVREAARLAVSGLAATARRSAGGDVALVFGTEMTGLTNDELARCALVAVVPANPAYASLNLAAAVQVMCYEMRMAIAGGDVWSAPRFAAASHDEIEGLYAHAARTLTSIAFLDPRMPRRLMPRLRRLFARAGLEKEEINILRGILARADELACSDRTRAGGPAAGAGGIAAQEPPGERRAEGEGGASRPKLREHRAGDWGFIVEQHGRLYAQEYGFDARFEAMVASIVAAIARDFDASRERCWIAELDGRRVGSVCLVRESESVARLRLLSVDPAARGHGLGRRLVQECSKFARSAGYRSIVLSTQRHLEAARRVYASEGYRCVASEANADFGPAVVAEDWELDLVRGDG